MTPAKPTNPRYLAAINSQKTIDDVVRNYLGQNRTETRWAKNELATMLDIPHAAVHEIISTDPRCAEARKNPRRAFGRVVRSSARKGAA